MINKTYLVDDVPGSLSNIYEIKVLICYLLKESGIFLSKNRMIEVFQMTGTVNYFNFCQALYELVKSKHIIQEKNDILHLTKIGADTVTLFQKNLPYSAMRKTMKALKELLAKENQSQTVKIKKRTDGFNVKLKLNDSGSKLFGLDIFCITEAEAHKLEKELMNKTGDVYRTALAVLNDDPEVLLQIAKKCDEKRRLEAEAKFT